MTRRRVIFPDPTVWTKRKRINMSPSREATTAELDAALVAIALLEAQADGDADRANFLLDEWRDDLAPILQYLLLLPPVLLNSFGVADHKPILDHFRAQIVAKLSEPS